MRTTLSLNDGLLAGAKRIARGQGRTISEVVEEALRFWLAKRSGKVAGFKLEWSPVRGDRLPGVDIADRDRLYDYMEKSD